MLQPIIAVVTRETRMDELKARWATAKQAQFRLQQAAAHEVDLRRKRRSTTSTKSARKSATAEDADLAVAAEALADDDLYTNEDKAYQRSLAQLLHELDLGLPLKTLNRSFLPNFDFARCSAIVVIGQDGLVANTAKYACGLPIVGVNPDEQRYDGVLLPFTVKNARRAVQQTIQGRHRHRSVTLAEVNTNDGQRMLAFNDFYVGASSHISARYTLEVGGHLESQSSSGIIISTGAGSTGWLSSLFNMTAGFAKAFGHGDIERLQMNWEDRQLAWAVREPFRSKQSGVELVAGTLGAGEELVVGSQMPAKGIIFSDGVEADGIEFSSGTIARFSISGQTAHLVVP
jgi:NAD kinase